jgi:hypothetical protein
MIHASRWLSRIFLGALLFATVARATSDACFDIDDTMLYLPTEIVLFGTGAREGEERGVSTERYARYKAAVGQPTTADGKESPYADFELRNDPKTGSFRNFNDSNPDGFVNDVLGAVDPANFAKRKGPAWDSIVYALSNPETAARTCFITARQHSRETLLKAFAALQKRGLIKFLPSLENLNPVGNPELVKLYGKDTPQAKVQVMAQSLDELAKQPLLASTPPVHGRDGASNERLHVWSFTDDDHDNFQAAVDELGQLMRADPARWQNVKIELYHVPKNKALRKAVVLKSDGTPRPFLSDEYTESFGTRMDRNASGAAPVTKYDDYETVESDAKSVEDTLDHMYVNWPLSTKHPKVSYAPDLTEVELNWHNQIIDDPAIPDADKRTLYTRYSVGDPRITDFLIKTFKRDIPTEFITDFNMSMEFPDRLKGEKFTNDYVSLTPKSNSHGQVIRDLLKAGYRINNPKWGIFSQPVFNESGEDADAINPIMHEKSGVTKAKAAVGRPVQYRASYSTNNATTTPRKNRLFTTNDPVVAEFMLQHADDLAKDFAKGGQIKDAETAYRKRIHYRDGTFQEIAYTNGRYNPNDRLVDLLRRGSSGEVRIKNVVFSHFVMTNGNVINELKSAMLTQPDLKVEGLIDDKFVPTRGYGLASTMKGFTVTRPIHGAAAIVPGWPPELAKRVNIGVFLKQVPGTLETEMDGYPSARDLQHDKTTVVRVEELNPATGKYEEWVYVFTGSLNNSAASRNAELQVMYRLKGDSPLAKAIEESVRDLARSEAEHVISLEKADVRAGMAQLLGRSTLELDNPTVDRAWNAIAQGSVPALGAVLGQVASTPTNIKNGVSAARAQHNLQTLGSLLGIHAKMRDANPLTPQDVVALMNLTSAHKPMQEHLSAVLDGIFGPRAATNPTLQARGQAALLLAQHHNVAPSEGGEAFVKENARRTRLQAKSTEAEGPRKPASGRAPRACARRVEDLTSR